MWRAVLATHRHATSLPQIPGIICTNKEIPDDLLVKRVRRWAASSEALSAGAFDLLQIYETADGRRVPRAICGLLRTEMLLAESTEPIKTIVTVFYRARDYLNSEFWEDQVKRLSDILAEEFLGGGRGIQLMVHHNTPAWALGLEIGDHRLLAEFETLDVVGNPLRFGGQAVEPELLDVHGGGSSGSGALVGHRHGFHRLRSPVVSKRAAVPGEVSQGEYVLRNAGGEAVCGVEVLGVLPSRLVCGAAWSAEGREPEFGRLVDELRRRAGRPMVSLLADPRDGGWRRLCGPTAAPLPGLWRSRKRMGVAVTGAPVGLSPELQARLAKAPFLVPWEFVPFHFGRLVLI